MIICVFVDSLSSCSLGSFFSPQLAFLCQFLFFFPHIFLNNLGFVVMSVSILDQIPEAPVGGGLSNAPTER